MIWRVFSNDSKIRQNYHCASAALELDPAKLDRKAIEEAIYGDKQKTKLIFPETRDKIKHYLDEAKQLTDVIDFHQPAEAARIE